MARMLVAIASRPKTRIRQAPSCRAGRSRNSTAPSRTRLALSFWTCPVTVQPQRARRARRWSEASQFPRPGPGPRKVRFRGVPTSACRRKKTRARRRSRSMVSATVAFTSQLHIPKIRRPSKAVAGSVKPLRTFFRKIACNVNSGDKTRIGVSHEKRRPWKAVLLCFLTLLFCNVGVNLPRKSTCVAQVDPRSTRDRRGRNGERVVRARLRLAVKRAHRLIGIVRETVTRRPPVSCRAFVHAAGYKPFRRLSECERPRH